MRSIEPRSSALRTPVDASAIREALSTTGAVIVAAVAAAFTGFMVGVAALAASANAMPLWLLARSAGITAYLLLTAVTALGLVLSHRTRARHRPHPSRIRLHLALVVFTLAFTVLHVVVLVLDPWAKVGLWGALLPLGAAYRPVPVTLGLLSLWAAVLAGGSAAMAGRGAGRLWLFLHRVAGSTWLLAWLHAVLTGVDTIALRGMYAATGLAIMTLALWRYLGHESAVDAAQQNRQAVRIR